MACSASFTLRVMVEGGAIPASISAGDVTTIEIPQGDPLGSTKRVFYTFYFLYAPGSPAGYAFAAAWTVTPDGPDPTGVFFPLVPQGVGSIMQAGRLTGEVTTSESRSYSCEVTLRQV